MVEKVILLTLYAIVVYTYLDSLNTTIKLSKYSSKLEIIVDTFMLTSMLVLFSMLVFYAIQL